MNAISTEAKSSRLAEEVAASSADFNITTSAMIIIAASVVALVILAAILRDYVCRRLCTRQPVAEDPVTITTTVSGTKSPTVSLSIENETISQMAATRNQIAGKRIDPPPTYEAATIPEIQLQKM